MKIGIIKETKIPVDHRVPFTPQQCDEIQSRFPGVTIVVQPSDIRCFKDEEYSKAGAILKDDLTDCDILFGVKEVTKKSLIPNKTYFFFSHTIKKQPYNKSLLQEVIRKGIQLVDYECLINQQGKRVVAFGRWAGIVGAYNGIRTYGLKQNLFDLKPAHQCFDMKELWNEFDKVKLPTIKILLTGGGRVTKGAQEVLDGMGIKNVSMPNYIKSNYSEPVYIQLDSDAYNKRKDNSPFDFSDFYNHPEKYTSTFGQYLSSTDILIAGAYWDPKAPTLFNSQDIAADSFQIQTIADITCDIQGSIPTTLRPCTIAEPFYDIDRATCSERPAFSNSKNITVMAIDNLPCELPRDASRSFGEMLIQHVIEDLVKNEGKEIVFNASICKNGSLTKKFNYLSDYIA